MNEQILIVEDEISLQETLAYTLQREGYEVAIAGDGETAVQIAYRIQPDLILLDVMLPGFDGFEVCRRVRQKLSMPIIFLTAYLDEIDRIVALEIGGDDYLAKPFTMRELLARIKAHIRRTKNLREQATPTPSNDSITTGNLVVWEKKREAQLDGQLLVLSPKEFDLLACFVHHQGKTLSRQYLLNMLWNNEQNADTRTIDIHVHRLREKLEISPSNPARIISVRNVGYCFRG